MILGLDVPTFIAVSIVVIGLAAFAAMNFLSRFAGNGDEGEVIDSEGFERKFNSIFTEPTKTQGAKIKDYVKIRGTSNTPRTIGLAYRSKRMDIEVAVYDVEDKEWDTKTSEGTEYRIIEGSEGIDMKVKYLKAKLGFKSDVETYDVPQNLITPGEDYIWFDNSAHFVKFNGVKRHLSKEGMSRGWEVAFSKTHENYLEASGDIPEQYSVLNNRINGQLKIKNVESENFRKFEKLKNEMEKLDTMNT